MTEHRMAAATGGRAGRQAARLAAPGRARPVPHADADAVRGALRGGPLADRGERRHDPRAGRDRLPRHARRARALARRRRRHRRRARALPARARADSSSRRRAPAHVHAGRAEPREQRRHRRREHGLRARVRLAVRPRPRQRPPLRDDRGLPQLREADVPDAVAAPLGRHRLRAGRPAGQQAALRHGLRAHALVGQAVHGLGHPPGAGARHGRDGPDPLRRGLPRGEHRRRSPDQRELAARLGLDDARRGDGVRGGEPGGDDDAVHPRGRDEPDHGRGHLRADARRVARRDDLLPARAPGRAGRARARSPRRCRCSRARRPSARPSRRSSST